MSGLARVLQFVEDEGLPESFSVSSQFRARKARCHQDTPYGPLLFNISADAADGSEPGAFLFKIRLLYCTNRA